MASQVNNYKCPACTGPLHFVGASGKLECDYCGSKYDVAEVEQWMKEEEQKAQQAFHEAEKKVAEGAAESGMAGEDNPETWGVKDGMKAYNCPSCGAELICDETTVATSCPYCGNPTVVPGQFDGMLKPDLILPFKLNQEQAKDALKMHYKGKTLLPSSFVSGNKINEIKGVYVPFWMYDGTVDAKANYEATKSHTMERGDVEVTETKHFDVYRAGRISYEKIPVDASSKMPDDYMDSIEPYRYEELKPFSSVYLPGFLADKYDVSKEECEKRADERAQHTALDILRSDVTGYDTCAECGHDVHIKHENAQYALLPTYLLATKWEGKDYLFAMNGQTGKLVGDLPVDMKKFWLYFVGLFACGTLLASAFLQVISDVWETSDLLISIGAGLAIAFVICMSMKASMKTARKALTARNYVPDDGINIRDRRDVYTHTTRTERPINRGNERNRQ